MFSLLERWFEQGRRKRALLALGLESGALAECPVCRTVTDSGCKACLETAQQLAQQWLERGDERIRPFRHDADTIREEMEALIEQAPVTCVCEDAGG